MGPVWTMKISFASNGGLLTGFGSSTARDYISTSFHKNERSKMFFLHI